ncbi:MAG: chemotaxis protein CheA [Nitrospinota bacterium]|nr:MAG: chemotaxis protein CheA [Nitrospinota bacterium]
MEGSKGRRFFCEESGHTIIIQIRECSMSEARERLVQVLKQVRAVVGCAETDETSLESLQRSLTESLSSLSPEQQDVVPLVRLMAQAVQALTQQAVPEPARLREALLDAVSNLEEVLISECHPERALLLQRAEQVLTQVLSPSPSPLPSLDDMAALLVQLEPTDLPEIQQVQEALTALAGSEGVAPEIREYLSAAAQQLTTILEGRAAEPEGALAEAGRMIEAALRAGGEAAPTEPSENPPPSLLPPDADTELLGEFITEGREYIEAAEAALLTLETDPDNMEAVNTVFRAFHTVKGTAGFLGLESVSTLAHRAETLLSRIRDREIRCTGGYADLALQAVDMLKALLQAVQDALGGAQPALPPDFDTLLRILEDPEAAGISEEAREEELSPPPRLGDLLVAEGKASREEVESAAAYKGSQPIGVALIKSGVASITDVAQALRTQKRLASLERPAEAAIRVRTDRLDRLIDLVGELVIAHAMVAQDKVIVEGNHYDLVRKVTHTGKIVRELQDLSMAMRMVPLRATFQKMIRLVRDIAHKQGKLVELITEGEETEIDRNMVDVLTDPLVHMVRNAVDHGIEPPEVREKQGKPRTGTIRLSAYHAGGNVVVELSDDGRGLDREKIVAKARAQGLIDSDKGLSEHELFHLIFMPGFSTAEQVTDVSGRGVGMDVVKRNVEALQGRIEVSSTPGRGSTFTIRVPLTLAITDGMLVRVGEERYIIPTVTIALSFRPEPRSLSTVVGRGELVRLRDELLPIIRLHRLFDIPHAVEDPTRGLLVVVNDGEQRSAILVDELLGQQQVVVKSLGARLGKMPGIAGGAILGDGRVGLILDPVGLVMLAQGQKSVYRSTA